MLQPRADQALAASQMVTDVDGFTDPGRVRKQNQDQFLIADLNRWLVVRKTGLSATARAHGTTCGTLMIVADGMGGHGGGDLASNVALDTLAGEITSWVPWPPMVDQLKEAFQHCQERVEAVAQRKGIADQKPGTTLTMGWVLGSALYLVHAGDSRCYLLRGNELRQLTRDHTLAQRIADDRRNHAMNEEQARELESTWGHVLTNAIGGGSHELFVEAHRVPLVAGDTLMLCSDGLTRHLGNPDVAGLLARPQTAGDCCRQMIAAANAAGGEDNITVIVCRL